MVQLTATNQGEAPPFDKRTIHDQERPRWATLGHLGCGCVVEPGPDPPAAPFRVHHSAHLKGDWHPLVDPDEPDDLAVDDPDEVARRPGRPVPQYVPLELQPAAVCLETGGFEARDRLELSWG
jgi:hypothetical protein